MNVSPQEIERVSVAFRALGEPTRLKIMLFIAECRSDIEIDDAGDAHPCIGKTVGDVCCHLNGDDRASSTISHHLKELKNAGLIDMSKQGRRVFCSVRPDCVELLHSTMTALRDNVCQTACV